MLTLSKKHDKVYRMNVHYIYMSINSMNGKRYLGQRKCPVNKYPWNDNYFGSGILITKALKKYGKDVFYRKILAVCHVQNIIDALEIMYIKHYNVLNNKDVWYNRDPGGQYGRTEDHGMYVSMSMKKYYSDRKNVDKSTAARMGITVEEYKKRLVKRKINRINKSIISIKKNVVKKKRSDINKQIKKIKMKAKLESEEYKNNKKEKRNLLSEKQKGKEFKEAVRLGKEKALRKNPNLYKRKRSLEEKIMLSKSHLGNKATYLHNLLWNNGYTMETLPKHIKYKIKSYSSGYKSKGDLSKYVLFISKFLNEIKIEHNYNLLLKEANDKRDIKRKLKNESS